MTTREKIILDLKSDNLTYEEIGKIHDVSKQYVSQVAREEHLARRAKKTPEMHSQGLCIKKPEVQPEVHYTTADKIVIPSRIFAGFAQLIGIDNYWSMGKGDLCKAIAKKCLEIGENL